MLADGNQTGNDRVIEWWRFDRMSTVYRPGSGRVTASFAAVAKLYGVGVDICLPVPARQPQGRGGEGDDSLAQRWWRSVPDDLARRRPGTGWTFCLRVGDAECAALGRGRGQHRIGYRPPSRPTPVRKRSATSASSWPSRSTSRFISIIALVVSRRLTALMTVMNLSPPSRSRAS
jgi:hypothetical protein